MQLAAQPAQVHVNGPVEDAGIVVAMDRVDQLVTGQHPRRPGHQRLQDAELERSQLQRRPVQAHGDSVRVQLQPIGHQDRLVGGGCLATPAEQRPHAGHQLSRRERLHHVVVRPKVQADDPVTLGAARREEQDGDLRDVAQASADLEAVHARQHHIQQHDVRLGACRQLQRGLTVGGEQGPMALALDIEAQQLPDLGVVVDQQHGGHCRRVYDATVKGS
jgi:hypothetical protein